MKNRERIIWSFLLIAIFLVGLVVRLTDLFDPPLDFHPTRQLHSALIARGMYYQKLTSAEEWKRDLSFEQWQAEGLIEPQIMERLAALSYRVIGAEQLWLARLWAIFFWMVGGVFLYKLAEQVVDKRASVFAVAFYMFWPYTAIASRSFQPESLQVAAILAALYAFITWFKKRTMFFALLTGLLCGFAIFVKSTAVFFLAFPILFSILQNIKIRAAFKDKQIWVMGILAALPYLAYLYYGIFVVEKLGSQFSNRFFPSRWVDIVFYIQWIADLNNTYGIGIILAALLGIFLLIRKEEFGFIVGYMFGYGVYGFVFSYHITTHDYYHIPLIIPISIGIGMLVNFVFKFSQRNYKLKNFFMAFFSILFVFWTAWEIRSTLGRKDYYEEPKKWQNVAEQLGQESRVIGIFPDYGYRLSYWGWMQVNPWITTGDVNMWALTGEQVDIEVEFFKSIEYYDYFIVADQEEFERQEILQDILDTNFPRNDAIDEVIVYDLRGG